MLNDKKGLSLVELIVAMSILLLVLAIAYPLYAFGERSFRVGSSQSIIQQNIRMASDFVSREVRYATNLRIYADMASAGIPNPIPSDHEFNYIVIDGSVIKHLDKDGETIIPQGLSDGVIFDLVFQRKSGNILYVKISGTDNVRSYDIETEVLLLNTSTLNDLSGKVIRYKKLPAPPQPLVLTPFNTETKVELDAPVSIKFNQFVSVLNLTGITISGGVTVDNVTLDPDNHDTILISHSDFPSKGTTYTVTIPVGAVQNNAGIINDLITWSFTTILPPPVITGVEILGDGVIKVSFAPQEVLPNVTNLASSIKIHSESSEINIIRAWIENGLLYILPDVGAVGVSLKTIWMSPGTVINRDGIFNDEITYTTSQVLVKPMNITLHPAEGAINVPVAMATAIYADFHEDIYIIGNLAEVSMVDENGGVVTIIPIIVDNKQFNIGLNGNLDKNMEYIITIPSGIVKSSSNNVENYMVIWKFRTEI